MSRYLLISLICVLGCTAPFETFYPSGELAKVEIHHVVWLGQTYDIRLDMASTTYNPGVGTLCLRYTSEEIFDMCQARDMLVDLVDSLLDQINDHPLLAKEITNYPLTYNDLDLVLTFDTFFGQYVDEQYVNQVRLQGGLVTFFAFTAFDCSVDYFEKHCEPYTTSQINTYAYRDARAEFPSDREREFNTKPVLDVIEGFQVPEGALQGGGLRSLPKRATTTSTKTPTRTTTPTPPPKSTTPTSSFNNSSSTGSFGSSSGASTGSRTPNTGY